MRPAVGERAAAPRALMSESNKLRIPNPCADRRGNKTWNFSMLEKKLRNS